MIVDSSAIVAIMLREAGWEELVDLIAGAASCGVAAPTLAETGIVLTARIGPQARGLIAGAGGLIRVGRLLPRPLALEIAMTGEPISAQRAQALGLVSRVVPAAALLDTALSLAELIASNGPLAVRLSKELVTAAPDLTMDEAWARNDALAQQIVRSEDMREGLQAFAEKRRPNWSDR